MKNWFKQQVTELTAWIGFFLILSSFIAPDWVFLATGVVLVFIDDKKAAEWVSKLSAWATKKLDRVDF